MSDDMIYGWKITKKVNGEDITIANGARCSLDYMHKKFQDMWPDKIKVISDKEGVKDGPKSEWERYSRVLGEKAKEVEVEAYPDGEGTWRCCGCGHVVRIEGHGSKMRYYCRLCQEVTDGGEQE